MDEARVRLRVEVESPSGTFHGMTITLPRGGNLAVPIAPTGEDVEGYVRVTVETITWE